MQLRAALVGLLCLCGYGIVSAAITVTIQTPDELVASLFDNSGDLAFSNAQLIGNVNCAGFFTNGQDAVPDPDFPDSGVVLSTGSPASLDMQDSDYETVDYGLPGDSDLDALVGGLTTDACVLQFDFTCNQNPCYIKFDYVWGSEEYNEWTDSSYNDVFAWFLNGDNIALIPGTSEPVSINTINAGDHSDLYNNNDPSDTTVPWPNMEADGFTTTLHAIGFVSQGTNTMKLVIADRDDHILDSWALLKAESFTVIDDPIVGGDPHFKRWGQKTRDSFQGECDLVLLHSNNYRNKTGLDLHIRTTLDDSLSFSYIESAALRIGNDIVEINNGYILLNGVKHTDHDLPLVFGKKSEFNVYMSKVESGPTKAIRRRHYRLDLSDGIEIEFRFYKQLMTFGLMSSPAFSDAVGMLGHFPTGAMRGRDGKTLENFIDFGFEWQVNTDDPKLFSDSRQPQLPYERCRMPTGPSQSSRRRLRAANRKLYEDATAACANQKGNDFVLCVDDVMMTGDLELANEW